MQRARLQSHCADEEPDWEGTLLEQETGRTQTQVLLTFPNLEASIRKQNQMASKKTPELWGLFPRQRLLSYRGGIHELPHP